MRDWATLTALAATKATGGTRMVLILVALHWSNTDQVSRPGTRRIAALAGCSVSTASDRLRALERSGDLVVEQRGVGKRATRYRLPALDDAIAKGGLAFASEGTLKPLASGSGPNTNGLAFGLGAVAFGSDPVAFGLRSVQGRTEVVSNEVTLHAGAREAEPGTAADPASGAAVPSGPERWDDAGGKWRRWPDGALERFYPGTGWLVHGEST